MVLKNCLNTLIGKTFSFVKNDWMCKLDKLDRLDKSIVNAHNVLSKTTRNMFSLLTIYLLTNFLMLHQDSLLLKHCKQNLKKSFLFLVSCIMEQKPIEIHLYNKTH